MSGIATLKTEQNYNVFQNHNICICLAEMAH